MYRDLPGKLDLLTPVRRKNTEALLARKVAQAGDRTLGVLHLDGGNLYGGVERLLMTVAAERHRCPKMEPHFAVCYEGRLSDELRSIGVPFHVLGGARLRNPFSILAARKRLARLLDEGNFDVIMTHHLWLHVIFGRVLRRHRIPLLTYLHIPCSLHWIERLARSTSPDLVLSNSQFTDASIQKLFPRVASEVFYPLISPPPMTGPRHRDEIRTEFGAKEGTVVIVICCRMERWKGHELLLKALSRLQTEESWQLWIVGGPQRSSEETYLASIRAMVCDFRIADRVRFLGERVDVARLLCGADIYCQPNISPEPFGLAFVEALSAGLPVVTTAMGGANEIVDSSCGILVPPGDEEALAHALGRLIRNKIERKQLTGGPLRAKLLCDAEVQLNKLYEFALNTQLVPAGRQKVMGEF